LAFLFFAATACERANTVAFDELITGASNTENPFNGIGAKEGDR